MPQNEGIIVFPFSHILPMLSLIELLQSTNLKLPLARVIAPLLTSPLALASSLKRNVPLSQLDISKGTQVTH